MQDLFVLAVIRLGATLDLRPRKQPIFFSNRGEARAELGGDRASEDESPRLDPGDLRRIAERIRESSGNPAEKIAVREQPPDVGMAVYPLEPPRDVAFERHVSSISRAKRGNRFSTARLKPSMYSSAASALRVAA